MTVLLSCFLVLLAGSLVSASEKPPGSTSLVISNLSGKAVDVYWVDTISNEEKYVLQNQKPIRNGTSSNIHSFNNHVFLAEFHDPETAAAKSVYTVFTKGAEDETVFLEYDAGSDVMTSAVNTAVGIARYDMEKHMAECKTKHGQDTDALLECISATAVKKIVDMTEINEHLMDVRAKISNRLRNYTCADANAEAPKAVRSYQWQDQDGSRSNGPVEVEVLLDRSAAKIWLAHNFITPDECAVLMEHGRPRLHRATVAADDGSSIISENRKAQQAGYQLDSNDASDPLHALYRRVFSMTNSHAGYRLDMAGQESFTIIQYNPEDQYTPHCDGACDGSQHRKGGRVATAVMYCKAPEVGGATTFSNMDIIVQPRVGSATFFSYKDMATGRMDHGDTEHSGCPVIRGEKWITTVWLREGVTVENDWENFDPAGTPNDEGFFKVDDGSDSGE